MDYSVIIRDLRRSLGLKQRTLASLLGVTQAAISRWETGLDVPSSGVQSKLRDIVDQRSAGQLAVEMSIIKRTAGLRALADIDGMRLLAASPSFSAAWPELAAAKGLMLKDHLLELSREVYNDHSIMRSILDGEIVMIAGVSDRQLKGFGDNAFRHYWAASYRKIGTKHYAEVSFEACEPDAELGLRHILRVDDLSL